LTGVVTDSAGAVVAGHGRFQACFRASGHSGSQMSIIEKKLKVETFGPITSKP